MHSGLYSIIFLTSFLLVYLCTLFSSACSCHFGVVDGVVDVVLVLYLARGF